MTKVLVLAGGTSPEREVSLRSGASVHQALIKAGYEVTSVDTKNGLENLPLQDVDVVFPALHGEGGEDGKLQTFLEAKRIPFVGTGSAASALCYDKARYAKLLKQNHILEPQTELVDLASFQRTELSKSPFVLKPNDGGSSIDTFIVRDLHEKDDAAITAAFETHGQLLLQELIEGDELTVAVLGEEALPVIEIIPPEAEEFDYENKYNGATQELCPPKNVSQAVQNQARQIALKVHQMTGCRDMSRTDIMVSSAGRQYVLETNTIPGLTDQSLLPKAAAVAGYDMPKLCDKLVQAALARD